MRIAHTTLVAALSAALFVTMSWTTWSQLEVGQTVTRFRVPQYDSEGRLTSQIFGDFAEVLTNGIIRITGLLLEMYQGTQVTMRVTAETCRFDRARGVAVSESAVRMDRTNLTVTGVGFAWHGSEDRVQLFQNVRVVLHDTREYEEAGGLE